MGISFQAAVTKDDDELDMIFEEESSDSEDESVPVCTSSMSIFFKLHHINHIKSANTNLPKR